MTWRVKFWRHGDPYPVSHYHHGEDAEAEARSEADELRGRDGIRNVEVDRIERTRNN